MIPDALAVPQFRAESTDEGAAAAFTARSSDEVMHRLRHPFEPEAAYPEAATAAGRPTA
ncbi:hypothetical protein AB0J80_32665 [Actinoplanes sp. NPDC049548]|uniref:hypothetical protein n=1 Tax=Actinoplanes sp. NPDC049548 TaxID=3155152 RepID=UPI003411F8A9